MTIPLTDQLVFVQRSRTLWPRLYAHWVAEGRMTEAEQAYEVACLAAVLATLERQVITQSRHSTREEPPRDSLL